MEYLGLAITTGAGAVAVELMLAWLLGHGGTARADGLIRR